MTRTAVLGVLLATLVSLPQSLLIAQEPQLGRVWPLDQLVTAPDLDSEVAAVFENAYGFNPLTEDQLRDIRWRETTVRSLGGFSSTVKAGKLAVQDPTDAAYEQEFARRLNTLLASTEGQNIMATLFFVFRESIVEQNEDKKYWLTKLKEMNEIAEALADQLKYLNDRLSQLEEKKRSKQYDTDDEEYDPGPEKVLVDLKVLALEADVDPLCHRSSPTVEQGRDQCAGLHHRSRPRDRPKQAPDDRDPVREREQDRRSVHQYAGKRPQDDKGNKQGDYPES
jgi:hypothetical protein